MQTGRSGRSSRTAIAMVQAADLRNRDHHPSRERITDGALRTKCWMADLHDRIRVSQQRATEVHDQIISIGRELVDAREVTQACSLFDPVWETLAPREQARVLHLLIERVDYDGENGNVSITFHPTGIRTLTQQHREEATCPTN